MVHWQWFPPTCASQSHKWSLGYTQAIQTPLSGRENAFASSIPRLPSSTTIYDYPHLCTYFPSWQGLFVLRWEMLGYQISLVGLRIHMPPFVMISNSHLELKGVHTCHRPTLPYTYKCFQKVKSDQTHSGDLVTLFHNWGGVHANNSTFSFSCALICMHDPMTSSHQFSNNDIMVDPWFNP